MPRRRSPSCPPSACRVASSVAHRPSRSLFAVTSPAFSTRDRARRALPPPPVHHRLGENCQAMEADYVIVGAGAARCVLAARLCEDPTISVLLLESGGRGRHPLLRIPTG